MFLGRPLREMTVRVAGRLGSWDVPVPGRMSRLPCPFFSSLLQDMLPMPGDPTQGTGNYNIEDFADLGMFPPFSE